MYMCNLYPLAAIHELEGPMDFICPAGQAINTVQVNKLHKCFHVPGILRVNVPFPQSTYDAASNDRLWSFACQDVLQTTMSNCQDVTFTNETLQASGFTDPYDYSSLFMSVSPRGATSVNKKMDPS